MIVVERRKLFIIYVMKYLCKFIRIHIFSYFVIHFQKSPHKPKERFRRYE
ncbi:hypothetical protein CSP5_0352 [Cuniculiplasma divulgatum]|uniref:Uncharacterized protein n=1 Tax=Cuniculiplasma divulgatum TaxID=1673428 RepID=A0A1N5STV8_9ARCH|nr:hypothetical protein CSP5_0352 [Cuniculiplasma divulgatum]SJK84206.1 hypothetical protein CPM_0321 [Cuniculiplasma divulgatum]